METKIKSVSSTLPSGSHVPTEHLSCKKVSSPSVDNTIYDTYGDRWYTAQDDPIALLRSEGKTKTPWIISQIKKHYFEAKSYSFEVNWSEKKGYLQGELKNQKNGMGTSVVSPAAAVTLPDHQGCFMTQRAPLGVLDIGCGAGFLTNALAREGFEVTGLDASGESLAVAIKYDTTKQVRYVAGDAYHLPFDDDSFDVVCAMDFLEHVERPQDVIGEINRVLKPGGQFFFHTFNRNLVARLVIIKGVEWFVKNTPPRLHVYSLFLKPQEVLSFCSDLGMSLGEIKGIRPRINASFFRLLWTREVPEEFSFKIIDSTLIAYIGWCQKRLP